MNIHYTELTFGSDDLLIISPTKRTDSAIMSEAFYQIIDWN